MNFINLYKQAGIGLANNYNICTQLLLHHLNAEVPHQWNMAGFSISHVIHKKLTERMYLLLNLGFRKELQSAWVENSYCESVIHFTSYFFCLRTSPHLSSINACVCSSFQMDNKKISHFHLYFSPLAMVTILKIKLHKVAGRFWQRSMQVHQWKCNYPLYQVFHL